MRVLVTGWDGLLGRSLVPCLRDGGHEIAGFGVADGDVADPAFVTSRLDAFAPDRVVHLAAMTAVDRCETEADEAFRVNELGTRVVAAAAESRGAAVLAISTDYVFNGRKGAPYVEEDAPDPLSVYGRSKLAGEIALRETASRWTIVRTAWLYGPGGPNFTATVLRLLAERETLSVVDDQRGCPTRTDDLAAAIRTLLERDAAGLYHVAGAGEGTWCDFAREIAALSGADPGRVRPATTAEIARPAPRPAYSVLDCSRATREAGIVLPPWREALRRHLNRPAGREED